MQAVRWLLAAMMALTLLTGCWNRDPAAPGAGGGPPSSGDGKLVTAKEFLRELVDLPLCGTPATDSYAGKPMCTVHLADGRLTLAGSGAVIRGFWQFQGDAVCRRDQRETVEQERCVRYQRLANGHFRNSAGVEVCLGPCPER